LFRLLFANFIVGEWKEKGKANLYDVVVAGGGPAGALTAYHLANAGLRTAVLDAQAFPRDKTCGGGLQHRAALHIPFDWRPALRSELDGVRFSFKCGPRFLKTHRAPLVYGILRREFDALLLDYARAAGACVMERWKVLGIGTDGGEYTSIDTSHGPLRARFVVGADGANSVVRQFVAGRSDYSWNVALSCEVPEECCRAGAADSSTMRIDWGTLASGYGWIFPKRGYLNIGVGGPLVVGRLLRPYLARLLETEGILKSGAAGGLQFRGHQLPTLLPGTPLSRGNVLLAGDAAGLVDPLTGDGISCALHSASIVTETLLQLFRKDRDDVRIYDRRILDEIGLELFWSRKMLSILTAFPRFVYEAVGHYDRVWRAFCRVMRGEDSLLIFRRKLEPLGPLRKIGGVFVGRAEARRMRQATERTNTG
jgi:geranylgeranyl reductase family protein